MAPLAGLYALDQPPQEMDQGVLEAHGGPVDPTHAHYGQSVDPVYPAAYGTAYRGNQYGPDVNQDTGNYASGLGGLPVDLTPSTHRSPYPKGLLQPNLETPGSYAVIASQLARQRSEIHGQGLGAARYFNQFAPGGRETPVNTTVNRYDAPNATMLAEAPGQLRQGNNGIGRDTTQGYGKLNETPEFQAGHSIRIVQHDTVHFDHSLDYSPGGPFWGRHEIAQATFDGPDSPYGVYGDTSTGQQVVWEGRIGNPTAYRQPPEPTTVQPSETQDVWAYYG
jgi:hypothetical protein